MLTLGAEGAGFSAENYVKPWALGVEGEGYPLTPVSLI